jgi:cytoskeletal protein RodZ
LGVTSWPAEFRTERIIEVASLQLPLRAARQKKGLALADIAGRTKIGVRYLQAIEDGDFEKLPGGLYDLSYMRQYAEAIEYDELELIAFYRDRMGLSEAPAAPRRSLLQRFTSLARLRPPRAVMKPRSSL